MTETKTAEPVHETFTLDLEQLKWQRPLHIPEGGMGSAAPTMTPWKALCGAILYDHIHEGLHKGHPVCKECVRLAWLDFREGRDDRTP
jgi:hypothetical protein